MATRIRLRRVGRKGQAYFRIVIADSKSPRDGRFVAAIGNYNPKANPAVIDVDAEQARDWIAAPHGSSILGRAQAAGLVEYRVVQLRDYTHDKHHTVDDAPYGGGAGMVLKPEPFFEAVEDLKAKPPIVLLSARGRRFEHKDAVRFAVSDELTLLCGHYKDVDQRVALGLGAEELSIGDFVLSGGEPAA